MLPGSGWPDWYRSLAAVLWQPSECTVLWHVPNMWRKISTRRMESGSLCFGIFRPRIYLPVHLQDEEKKFVIEHEKVHIARKDHLIKMLAYISVCIHWFNPLVWLAFVLMERALPPVILAAVLLIGVGVGLILNPTQDVLEEPVEIDMAEAAPAALMDMIENYATAFGNRDGATVVDLYIDEETALNNVFLLEKAAEHILNLKDGEGTVEGEVTMRATVRYTFADGSEVIIPMYDANQMNHDAASSGQEKPVWIVNTAVWRTMKP